MLEEYGIEEEALCSPPTHAVSQAERFPARYHSFSEDFTDQLPCSLLIPVTWVADVEVLSTGGECAPPLLLLLLFLGPSYPNTGALREEEEDEEVKLPEEILFP